MVVVREQFKSHLHKEEIRNLDLGLGCRIL